MVKGAFVVRLSDFSFSSSHIRDINLRRLKDLRDNMLFVARDEFRKHQYIDEKRSVRLAEIKREISFLESDPISIGEIQK